MCAGAPVVRARARHIRRKPVEKVSDGVNVLYVCVYAFVEGFLESLENANSLQNILRTHSSRFCNHLTLPNIEKSCFNELLINYVIIDVPIRNVLILKRT